MRVRQNVSQICRFVEVTPFKDYGTNHLRYAFIMLQKYPLEIVEYSKNKHTYLLFIDQTGAFVVGCSLAVGIAMIFLNWCLEDRTSELIKRN